MSPRKRQRIPKLGREPHEHERFLLDQLFNIHGYMLSDAPRGKRITMVMRTREAKTDGPARQIVPYYNVTLMVPPDSALGQGFAERYGERKPPTLAQTRQKLSKVKSSSE